MSDAAYDFLLGSAGYADFFSTLPGGAFAAEPSPSTQGMPPYIYAVWRGLQSPNCPEREQVVMQALKSYALRRILLDDRAAAKLHPFVAAVLSSKGPRIPDGQMPAKVKEFLTTAANNPFSRTHVFNDIAAGLEQRKASCPAATRLAALHATIREWRKKYAELLPAPHFMNTFGGGEAARGKKGQNVGATLYSSAKHFRHGELVVSRSAAPAPAATPDIATDGAFVVDPHAKMTQFHTFQILSCEYREMKEREEAARAELDNCEESKAIPQFEQVVKSLMKEFGHVNELDHKIKMLEVAKGKQSSVEGAAAEVLAWKRGSSQILRSLFDAGFDADGARFCDTWPSFDEFQSWFYKCQSVTLSSEEVGALAAFLGCEVPKGAPSPRPASRSTSAPTKKSGRSGAAPSAASYTTETILAAFEDPSIAGAAERFGLFQTYCTHVARKPIFATGSSFKYAIDKNCGELDVALLCSGAAAGASGSGGIALNWAVCGVVEVKLNQADLIYARRQRVKLAEALAAFEADPKAFKTLKLSSGFVFFADDSRMQLELPFSAALGLVGRAMMAKGRDGPVAVADLTRHFMFATGRDPTALGKLPIYSKFTHVLSRQLGFSIEFLIEEAMKQAKATLRTPDQNAQFAEKGYAMYVDSLVNILFEPRMFKKIRFSHMLKHLGADVEKWFRSENNGRATPALITPRGVLEECVAAGVPIVFF